LIKIWHRTSFICKHQSSDGQRFWSVLLALVMNSAPQQYEFEAPQSRIRLPSAYANGRIIHRWIKQSLHAFKIMRRRGSVFVPNAGTRRESYREMPLPEFWAARLHRGDLG
jgi:hypothetical protein